jgi:ATP dependent DNA ligase domain
LTRLVEDAPQGAGWLHEVKYDGYRMHARIDGDKIQLLTRTGLDWSHRYERTIEALRSLKVKSAYLDGELCALNADGVSVFSRLQAAMDEGRTDQLVFFAFDLMYLNGESTAQLPLIERKERLERLFNKQAQELRYSEHVVTDGPRFREHACKLGLEGIISKRIDRPYAPGEGTAAPRRSAGSAAGGTYAGSRGAAPRQPVRLSARGVQGALGTTGDRRGSDLPDLDRGQSAAAGLISGSAGGQACQTGGAVHSAWEALARPAATNGAELGDPASAPSTSSTSVINRPGHKSARNLSFTGAVPLAINPQKETANARTLLAR